MFRRDHGAWGRARAAVVVVAAVALGAVVLRSGGDRPLGSTLQLRAVQTAPTTTARPVDATTGDTATRGSPPPVAAAGTSEVPTAVLSGIASTTVAAATPVSTSPTTGTSQPDASTVPTSPTTTAPATTATTPPSPSTTTSTPTTTTTTAPPGPVRNRTAEAAVVPLTNADRGAASLGQVSRDSCLDAVAAGYAEQMARSQALVHNPGSGAAIAGCRSNPTWGDNIGTVRPCDTTYLEQQWMASPSHRHNILTAAFTYVGVGAWTDDQGGCWVQVLFSS